MAWLYRVRQIASGMLVARYSPPSAASAIAKLKPLLSAAISLGKNTAAFVRLPNTDLFGLVEWYPGLKKTGKTARKPGEKDQPTSPAADDGSAEEAAGGAAAPINIIE